jgi:hypothetical protein
VARPAGSPRRTCSTPTGEDRVLVSGEDAERFFLSGLAWAPSGDRLVVAGWEDLGEGHIRMLLRIVPVEDPAGFREFEISTGEISSFLVSWER